MKNQKGLTVLALIIIIVIGIAIAGTSIVVVSNLGEKDNYSAEELLDMFAKAVSTGDYELFRKTLPKTISDEAIAEMYSSDFKENFNQYTKDVYEEEFGNNITMKFNITGKVEESQEWCEENAKFLAGQKIDKAYRLEGTLTITGSKKTETMDLEETWYCQIDGAWGLLVG